MSFPGVPQYTPHEDAKLRHFYPTHCRSHVLRALPDRTWRSIRLRAHYLSIGRTKEARQLEAVRVDRDIIKRFTKLELAYLAGLLDGEGCICFSKQKTPAGATVYTCQVSIANTSTRLRDWLSERLCGRIYKKTYPVDGTKRVKARRQCYAWTISGNNLCRFFLKAVAPYLVIKRKQAELMMRGYLHLSQAERLALWERMRDLKRTS
jgi:hypothetical protein